jgi:fructokinase
MDDHLAKEASMEQSQHKLCVFGEVLFDHFPDGSKVLGGAPFNVAWHLQAFAQTPLFVSAVGNDNEGQQILSTMRAWGMSTEAVKQHPDLPTGTVSIELHQGEPQYQIEAQCAYDDIEFVQQPGCELLYHGSLALRAATSQQSFDAFVASLRDHGGTIFLDVNLRHPWWDRGDVRDMMRAATWVKLNHDELNALCPAQPLLEILEVFDLDGILLTHGADGAEVLLRNGSRVRTQPDHQTSVVDAVGAGDAFSAVFLLGLIQQWGMQQTMDRAQTFASTIVSQRGAICRDAAFYQKYIEAWSLHYSDH